MKTTKEITSLFEAAKAIRKKFPAAYRILKTIALGKETEWLEAHTCTHCQKVKPRLDSWSYSGERICPTCMEKEPAE